MNCYMVKDHYKKTGNSHILKQDFVYFSLAESDIKLL